MAPVVRVVRVRPVVIVAVAHVVPAAAVVGPAAVGPAAIAVRVAPAHPVAATSSAWAPMASPCRASRARRARPWIVVRARLSRRAWAPTASLCLPSRVVTASRWGQTLVATDLTESRGIPSVAPYGRPSAQLSRPRVSSR